MPKGCGLRLGLLDPGRVVVPCGVPDAILEHVPLCTAKRGRTVHLGDLHLRLIQPRRSGEGEAIFCHGLGKDEGSGAPHTIRRVCQDKAGQGWPCLAFTDTVTRLMPLFGKSLPSARG
ncbi:hypothetical protein BSA145_21290 (plasmid) [Bacillus safensis]|uniref:Uncharacterized protein n=1 Tax=Bacillus safensis TaxID=561879 RepID=A0A1L6ZPH4_BACIA|nr:hypothetical protein BSA145_21290 [Bacillus safensis]